MKGLNLKQAQFSNAILLNHSPISLLKGAYINNGKDKTKGASTTPGVPYYD